MRYAIYYTPAQHEPLARLAASWLARDAFTGLAVAPPVVASLSAAEIAYHTASPRRYGFHATLKAPFQLASGETEAALEQAMADFAPQMAPVSVALAPSLLDGFLALMPAVRSTALDDLAGAVVRRFDRFRAPLSEREIERRNPDTLSLDEFSNLCQWGYPYVFDRFQFHMTLTGRLAGHDIPPVRAAVDQVFAQGLEAPISVDSLALFVEPEPGAPFQVKSLCSLGRDSQRKTA